MDGNGKIGYDAQGRVFDSNIGPYNMDIENAGRNGIFAEEKNEGSLDLQMNQIMVNEL